MKYAKCVGKKHVLARANQNARPKWVSAVHAHQNA